MVGCLLTRNILAVTTSPAGTSSIVVQCTYLGHACRICLSLIALVLIVVLLRMGAFLGPVTHLIIVETWLIALGSC